MDVTVNEGEYVLMASKGDTVSIYYLYVDSLEKLGGEGECFTLGDFGYFRKIT